MSKYNSIYRKSKENIIETLKIAIKRNSAELDVSSESLRVDALSSSVLMDTEEIFDLIPPFSPSATNSLSAEKWIETIEDLRVIYGWDDRLTLVYASLRLEDAAKRWYKENVCDWPEFKVKFVRRFSNHISKEEYFEQLLNRRKEYNESYENYVFDMERTALKCDCSVESTINYIISGLRDSLLKNQLIAMNCKSVDALLSRMKKLAAVHENNDDLRNRLGRSSSSLAEDSTNEIVSNRRICFKCRKPGHYASDCWSKTATVDEEQKPHLEEPLKESVLRRAIMCVNCKKFGHYANACTLKEVFCHRCKRKGHTSYDCRSKVDPREERMDRRNSANSFRDQNVNDDIFCVICNTEGHHRDDCTSYDLRLGVNNDAGEEREIIDHRNSEHFFLDTKGHHRKDCGVVARRYLSEDFCKNCNQRGHRSSDCQVKVSGHLHEERKDDRRQINREWFCVKCKTKGHHARDCQASSSFNDSFCHNCRRKGHKSESCHLIIDQKLREERRRSRNSENFSQNTEIKKCKTEDRHEREHNDRNRICDESPKISRDDLARQRDYQKCLDDKKRNESRTHDIARSGAIFCRKCESKNHKTEECNFNTRNDSRLRQYPSENIQKSARDRKEDSKRNCYNCRKSGHFAKDCPLDNNLKRSSDNILSESVAKKTKVSVSNAIECQPKNLVPEKNSPKGIPYASIKLSRSLSEFLKPVRIDNVYVTALVNLASDCTTLQKSEFQKHDWKIEPCNLEVNGFGHCSAVSIGKISKNVRVEEVELMTEIIIVEDDLQDFPLVLGSNFLDHPSVCVVKKYKSLEIKLVDSVKETAQPMSPASAAASVALTDKEQQIKIKTEIESQSEPEFEPEPDVEEHLLELLNIIKEDC